MIASFAYRMVIMLTIALFVAGKLFIVGVLLALWSIYGFLVHPVFKVVKSVMTDGEIRKKRGRLYLVSSLGLFGVVGLLFALPLPKTTLAQGVLWVPGEYRVVSESRGMIDEVLVDDAAKVAAGQVLISGVNPELDSKIQLTEGRIRELDALSRNAQSEGRKTEYRLIAEERAQTERQLERLRELRQGLRIRSPADGVFRLARPEYLPGRYVNRGEELGYILVPGAYVARVLVDQDDIDAVRGDVRAVSIRFAEQIGRIYPSRLIREVPGAHRELPSLALSVDGGGPFALDPEAQGQPRAYSSFFQYEVALEGVPAQRIGERLYARISHSPEPIGYRWLRAGRRLLLERLDF
ncbi:MAG: hypothetical protein B0D87_08185 [Candidatus Sedimenticola endophacoides]|nr:MAG: hypothetical protein B0D94_11390 [Candidatus Sedimenticola endophacoides]OQX45596.1 MAG: hypothetical protein B0D86_03400 [Candidatus Sedimenticola endophacoides]OQX47936.1 MAG: hypothetical protein B0D87_08185 [Candidatus Sedimenticola endophacoides]